MEPTKKQCWHQDNKHIRNRIPLRTALDQGCRVRHAVTGRARIPNLLTRRAREDLQEGRDGEVDAVCKHAADHHPPLPGEPLGREKVQVDVEERDLGDGQNGAVEDLDDIDVVPQPQLVLEVQVMSMAAVAA